MGWNHQLVLIVEVDDIETVSNLRINAGFFKVFSSMLKVSDLNHGKPHGKYKPLQFLKQFGPHPVVDLTPSGGRNYPFFDKQMYWFQRVVQPLAKANMLLEALFFFFTFSISTRHNSAGLQSAWAQWYKDSVIAKDSFWSMYHPQIQFRKFLDIDFIVHNTSFLLVPFVEDILVSPHSTFVAPGFRRGDFAPKNFLPWNTW